MAAAGPDSVGFPLLAGEAPPSLFVHVAKVDKKACRKETSGSE